MFAIEDPPGLNQSTPILGWQDEHPRPTTPSTLQISNMAWTPRACRCREEIAEVRRGAAAGNEGPSDSPGPPLLSSEVHQYNGKVLFSGDEMCRYLGFERRLGGSMMGVDWSPLTMCNGFVGFVSPLRVLSCLLVDLL